MLDACCSTTGTRPWAAPSRAADPLKIPIDPNGNLTQKTEGTDNWVYTWNAENQLTKVEKNGAEIARFAYDPLGRRVEKVAGGVTAEYVYDSEAVLRESKGAAVWKYVNGWYLDEPLGIDSTSTLTTVHADALGSVVKLTDPAGATVQLRSYDAWGGELTGSQSGTAFTGREWDSESGLYYYRARYYDASTGRFLSEDPIGFREGVNFYAYVSNNPATLMDPFGLQAAAVPAIITAAGNAGTYWNARTRSQNRTTRDRRMDPSNRMTHCMMNCELVSTGTWEGAALSFMSDWVVVTAWPPPGVTPENDPKDRQANACGRWAARNGKNCAEFCRAMMESGAWKTP